MKVLFLLSLGSTFFGVACLFVNALCNKNKGLNCVKSYSWFVYLGVLFSLGAVYASIYSYVVFTDGGIYLGFAQLLLAWLFYGINYSIYITYDSELFTIKRLFRKSKTFTYKDITGIIDEGDCAYTLLIGSSKYYVGNHLQGGFSFYLFAKEQYLKSVGSPILSYNHLLFNGFVKEPIPIVVMVLLVDIISTLVVIGFSLDIYLHGSKNVILNGHYIGELSLELILLWVMILGLWVVSIAGYYILSHAPQYPILASLLLKKTHRNW